MLLTTTFLDLLPFLLPLSFLITPTSATDAIDRREVEVATPTTFATLPIAIKPPHQESSVTGFKARAAATLPIAIKPPHQESSVTGFKARAAATLPIAIKPPHQESSVTGFKARAVATPAPTTFATLPVELKTPL
ncbi:hypothetical protein K491DRAFT_734354 [Lophiostoma macrostomum CBS 122681]|uniref:Uncharacterized protein n=1 Tax=Lophiostoma macrostomum CBS 122681 TaxID=1314788 RepID=A0A6A6THE4_9PLEO|nr:hypothetical protein K491DRAFT_734354 [Lophiostoma macrostomum CBS 122681]